VPAPNLGRGIEGPSAFADLRRVSFSIPSGFDPQASLDAALFAAAGGSPAASSDPAVDALDALGGSYGDEIAFLQQELAPTAGAYGPAGALPGSPGDSEAAQLEQALSGLLGGGSGLGYDPAGSLLDGGASALDVLG
jgi:hypothetical protein